MADKTKPPIYSWEVACVKCGPLKLEGHNFSMEEIPMRDVFFDAQDHLADCPGPVAILLHKVGER